MYAPTMFPDRENVSSVVEILTPEERDKLDRALVMRTPASYKAAYQQFHLAEKGISYSAYYRYARRLRTVAQATHLAELTMPEEEEAERLTPRFVCQQLLQALLSEEASPRAVERLTNAFRMASSVQVAWRRLDLHRDRLTLDREHLDLKRHIATSPPNDRSRVGCASYDPYDPDAPWGRKEDGTPYTHKEFMSYLRPAVRDIYGLDIGDDSEPSGEGRSEKASRFGGQREQDSASVHINRPSKDAEPPPIEPPAVAGDDPSDPQSKTHNPQAPLSRSNLRIRNSPNEADS